MTEGAEVLQAVLSQGQQIGHLTGMMEQHITNQDLVNAQLAKLIADQELRVTAVDTRVTLVDTKAENAHRRLSKVANRAIWTGGGVLGTLGLLGISISSKIKHLLEYVSRLP